MSQTNRNHMAMADVILAEDAVINAVSSHEGTGFITITYDAEDGSRGESARVVTLIVGDRTCMSDQFGNRIRVRDFRENMEVDAVFSSRMTRSIPPQSEAYSIVVVKENEDSKREVGRVMQVDGDRNEGYLWTGDANDLYSQTRFVISRETKLRDRNGNPITLRDIRPGQIVKIERASFQTASLPPQTNAFSVQLLSC